jgi:hypothetical protein
MSPAGSKKSKKREPISPRPETPAKRQFHKDWRTWLLMALMLAAIGMYVLTLDDSVVPVSRTGSSSQSSAAPSKP